MLVLQKPSGHSFQLVLPSAAMTHWHYYKSGGLSFGLRESKNSNTMCCTASIVAGKTLVSWTQLPQANRSMTVAQFLLHIIITVFPSI